MLQRSLAILYTLFFLIVTCDASYADIECDPGETPKTDMGSKIQAAIKEQSFDALLPLIADYADNVPRPKDVAGHDFSDIFPLGWQEAILNSLVPCKTVGWRGYMLARGLLWYEDDGIIAFNSIYRPWDESEFVPWSYRNKAISPACLSRIWLSKDNYEYIYDNYLEWKGIREEHFQKTPGFYIGNEIPLGHIEGYDRNIGLAVSLEDCLEYGTEIVDGWVRKLDNCDFCNSFEYRVLSSPGLEICTSYMTGDHLECIDVAFVHTRDAGGGTLGQTSLYTLYGIVKIWNEDEFIVPLENFHSKQRARDRIDEISLD